MDVTMAYRKRLSEKLNLHPDTRQELEMLFGKEDVFDSAELSKKFEIIAFLSPFVSVRRKCDNTKGVVLFQDQPRFYFNFTKGK